MTGELTIQKHPQILFEQYFSLYRYIIFNAYYYIIRSIPSNHFYILILFSSLSMVSPMQSAANSSENEFPKTIFDDEIAQIDRQMRELELKKQHLLKSRMDIILQNNNTTNATDADNDSI